MTYYSLQVLDHPQASSDSQSDDPPKPGALIQDLDSYARVCGAYGAIAWAKSRNLIIHYVDNCWVYVTVDRDDLADFMTDVLEGQVTPDPQILPKRRYLLMAEEF